MGAPLSADVPDERVEGLLKEWLDDRSRAIRKVRALLTELKIATETRSRAVAERTRTSEDLDVAEAALNGARERRAAAESAWWQDVDTWRTGANELAPHLADIDDPFTARAIVDEALDRAREPLRDRTTLLRERSRTTSNELQRVLHELEQWHAGREPEPEPRAGRRDRAGLEGAPLWRLVDFSPELDASARAGLEAALLESGLLDAWMSSDGSLALPPDVSDVLVAAAAPPRHPPATAPLVPDSSASAINHAAVAALLGSIRWVDRDAHLEPPGAAEPQGLVLGKDGTWRTPHLAGRAPVQPARFIGAASREAARQARIDALERERDELREQLNGIHRELDDVQRRIASCNAQAAAFPSTGALEQATQQVRDAESLVSVSTEALHAATERAHAAEAACKTAQAALMRTATAHGLPTEAPSLDESDRQVDRLRQAVNSLARALDSLPPARTVEARATELALAAQARAHASAEEARTLELELQQASAKLRALREALGASFAELMQRLAEIRKRLAEVHHARTSLLADDRRLERQLGSLEQQCKDTESKRDAAQRKRQSAHDAYVDLCRDGLLGDAELGVAPVLAELHNLTAQLESARKVNADPALPKPPEDAAVTALHSGVSRSLHEASQQLAGRVQVTFEAAEREWAVLRARREGERVSARELRDSIELDRDRAREELDRKQQELFEEILTGSLREHLKLRLWSAQALVDRINTLLKGVRSAAGGVGVSLRWDIDPDQPEKTQLKRAKELLLHDSPAADGRLELDGFLRSRIEQIRADERDTGDWRQRLEQMLDYRAWHRFTVLVHHHRFGEGARELTSRKVALSAGEKTIVMVLPLIAALTAHYEPASNEPPCESPRLLLMDELFPKLDFANKKQLMGLLPQLQLDGVFTSDKDRCEYETLDGIAIHVVQKLDDDKTTTTRMVWNGSMLRVTTGAEPEAPSARLV
jgi:regulator of replication initiation timing